MNGLQSQGHSTGNDISVCKQAAVVIIRKLKWTTGHWFVPWDSEIDIARNTMKKFAGRLVIVSGECGIVANQYDVDAAIAFSRPGHVCAFDE